MYKNEKKRGFNYFDDYLRHLRLNALKLQGFDGRFGCRWRIEINETVAFALVGILIENGFGRNDGTESNKPIQIDFCY